MIHGRQITWGAAESFPAAANCFKVTKREIFVRDLDKGVTRMSKISRVFPPDN